MNTTDNKCRETVISCTFIYSNYINLYIIYIIFIQVRNVIVFHSLDILNKHTDSQETMA